MNHRLISFLGAVLMMSPINSYSGDDKEPFALEPGMILVGSKPVDAVFAVDPNTAFARVVSRSRALGDDGVVGSGVEFRVITDLSTLSDGSILVTDGNGDAVIHVDPATGNRTRYSAFGVGDGPNFAFPARIAVDHVTDIAYIADPGANAIFAVDPDTRDRTIISGDIRGGGPAFERVSGIGFGRTRFELIVFDLDGDNVMRIDVNSGNREIIAGQSPGGVIGGGPEPSMTDIAADRRGIFYADNSLVDDDQDDVYFIDGAGNRRVLSSPLSSIGSGSRIESANGIALTPQGDLVVGSITPEEIFCVRTATGDRELITNAFLSGQNLFVDSLHVVPGPVDVMFKDSLETPRSCGR